jgi:transposase
MSASKHRSHRSSRSSSGTHLGKPKGILSPRVQKVGPEHFGIVAVDPAKARSCWLFADFYGRVLIPPTNLEHRRDAFDEALARLRQVIAAEDIKDLVVAVELTGVYHRPVMRAFSTAGYDTRIVHPNVSHHFRRIGSPNTKTDPIDASWGVYRAAVNGFGLQEPPWDPLYTTLQLLARHRRDLVQKDSLLRCQILEHLEAFLPGYARCFDDVFRTKIALAVPNRYPTPQAVAQAGLEGLTELARLARVRVQARTLTRILGWAHNAPVPGSDADWHRQFFTDLNADRIAKEKQIRAVERQLVGPLAQTPYVRLLSLPGINVVLASELAGEAGPMVHYATARVLTGRAGLYPRRSQSDEVDHASGSLARCGNRRLRQALLWGADTLIRCNEHFAVRAAKWTDQGKHPKEVRVRVAGRYSRIAFQMVSGTKGFDHPACQDSPAVLSKLREFHELHEIDPETTRTNLRHAAASLPDAEQPREWANLATQRDEARSRRGRKAAELVVILSAVLDEPGEKAARVIASTSADAASSLNDEKININKTGTNLGPPAAGLPPGEPARQHRDQNRNAQATHASHQNDEKINTKTTGTNLGPPTAGLPPGEPARRNKDQNRNVQATHASHNNDEKININTTGTNLGPPAAGLPPGEPARKPAVPHGQGQGQVGRSRRGRGPQPLNAFLPVVLEQLLGGDAARLIESIESGETP